MFKKTILIFLLLSFSSALIAGTSSSNQKKASWVSLENLQKLLKEFDITTKAQFFKKHPKINAEAQKRYGKKVPKNPVRDYKTTWNEIRGETKVSLKTFKELLKKYNIIAIRQYRRNYPKINAEAQKRYRKKVPTDPVITYKISWSEIVGEEEMEMISLKNLQELLKEFEITIKAKFFNKHSIIDAEAQKIYGKKVPKNPLNHYAKGWNEIVGKATKECAKNFYKQDNKALIEEGKTFR